MSNSGVNHKVLDPAKDGLHDAVYTTSNGARYPHPYEAQRVGQDGPLLLQDFHLIDLLSHFDRERIPERVVHAKGAGAWGTFKVTKGLEDLSIADFLKTGSESPVIARFSTVGGESGSPDTARDPRGFSVKIKTAEGNIDWVFNNTPVFFLRDPAKFPHFIHTQKRDPQTHLNGGTDSTMFWEYLSHNPESLHQVMILFGDRGVPDGYRKMHGYSGHTFKLVNKEGKFNYVQIHLRSEQGASFLTQEKAVELSGSSPDYATKDLFDAIEKGDFPRWKAYVQVMTPEQAEKYKYNVFDLTKVWPHADFPLREFGVLELNRNPRNYFAEIEQAAFSPSHLVPGVEASADPVLQSRLFSYPDTHRHRLGVNYPQLPVNQHLVENAGNFQRDGSMAFYNQGTSANYLSSIKPITLAPRGYELDQGHNRFIGDAVAYLSQIQPIDFEQPRALWEKVFDDGAKERFVNNVAGHWATCKKQEVLQRQLAIFHEASPDLAARLAKASGIKEYPKGVEGVTFNGIRNSTPSFKSVNKQGYSNGYANGHPSENLSSKATPIGVAN